MQESPTSAVGELRENWRQPRQGTVLLNSSLFKPLVKKLLNSRRPVKQLTGSNTFPCVDGDQCGQHVLVTSVQPQRQCLCVNQVIQGQSPDQKNFDCVAITFNFYSDISCGSLDEA